LNQLFNYLIFLINWIKYWINKLYKTTRETNTTYTAFPGKSVCQRWCFLWLTHDIRISIRDNIWTFIWKKMSKTLLVLVSLKYCAEKMILKTHVTFFMKLTVCTSICCTTIPEICWQFLYTVYARQHKNRIDTSLW
jgi:hypothetical protein